MNLEEFEYKCILTQEEYEQVVEKLKAGYGDIGKEKMQINYYFDTKDYALQNAGITMRIRQIDSKLSLQVKLPVGKEKSLKIKKEISQSLDTFPLKLDLEKTDFAALLPCTGIASFIGVMVTERTKFDVEQGIEIDLDKSSYLGHRDYELEIEFDPAKKAEAYKILVYIMNKDDFKASDGKKERFFKRYMTLLEE